MLNKCERHGEDYMVDVGKGKGPTERLCLMCAAFFEDSDLIEAERAQQIVANLNEEFKR